jgi:prepilin-type N-terminal cleavage/methylation domain-containing protein
MRRVRQSGFTLIELVVAITISAIILVFVTMFIAAPIKAYDEQSRRVKLTAGPVDAWPRMEEDLRTALPNSVRTRRNGSFVVLEMLSVTDVVRYMQPTSTTPFKVAGVFRNTGITLPGTMNGVYLSAGNTGLAGADAYTLTGSMTPASSLQLVALAANEEQITATPAANLTATSPKHWVYLVSGPVTYLCDESQGTVRRYSNYIVLPSQASWDSPAEFNVAGATNTLVARGITSCNFVVWPLSGGTQQTVALHLTSTDSTGDTVQLLHTYRTEYVP